MRMVLRLALVAAHGCMSIAGTAIAPAFAADDASPQLVSAANSAGEQTGTNVRPVEPEAVAPATTISTSTIIVPTLSVIPDRAALPELSLSPAPPVPLGEAAPAASTAATAPAVLPSTPGQEKSTAAASKPADNSPIVAEIRDRLKKTPTGLAAKDREDRLALQQFYDAPAAVPVWVDDAGLAKRGGQVIAELQAADDWGLRPRDFDVAGKITTEAASLAEAEIRIASAALKYARHARGGRVDPLELSNYLDRKANLLPSKMVLEQLAAATEPAAYLRGLHPQHPQFEKLRRKLVEVRLAPPKPAEPQPAAAAAEAPQQRGKKGDKQPAKVTGDTAPPPVSARKLIANMEMWRWMPADLGERHILANVPEFQFRYIKTGQVIHSERIVVGKIENQTPIFSDLMEHIIFHPTWNVPDSIKVKELLPNLARGGNILERQGLRATLGGRPVDPSTVDWRAVDIRNMHVFQPSGQGNALGLMKFMFPNKHAVYMHDTPSKPLFNSASRAFSHGCVRVRNPQRFAEVILAEDKGWGPDRIRALLDTKVENSQVNLTTRIPVHIVYFTTWVDDEGKLASYRDLYGYEEKIQLGLDGKAHTIVKKQENLGQIRAEVVGRLAETRAPQNANLFGWMNQIFGN